MFRLVLASIVLVVVSCQKQFHDPRQAAIIQEQRYLSGDGTFGAAYQQEDGIDFKEESDAEGNRKGSYSYVDPTGQRRTIHYTAGKNGFQATGDHIPVPANPPAPVAPQPQYNPAPIGRSGSPDPEDGQYYPELYERESESKSAQPQYNAIPQYKAIPQAPQKFQSQNVYAGASPQAQQYSGVQSAHYTVQPTPQYYQSTTQVPTRFFPPGKFNLNRSPDGFTYTFSQS